MKGRKESKGPGGGLSSLGRVLGWFHSLSPLTQARPGLPGLGVRGRTLGTRVSSPHRTNLCPQLLRRQG